MSNEFTCDQCGSMFCVIPGRGRRRTRANVYCSKKCAWRARTLREQSWKDKTPEQKEIGRLRSREWRSRPENKARQQAYSDGRSRWECNSLELLSQQDRERTIAVYKQRDVLNKQFGPNSYQVDHILPRSVGGDHVWYNLQIITTQENLEKGSNFRHKDYLLYVDRINQLFNES